MVVLRVDAFEQCFDLRVHLLLEAEETSFAGHVHVRDQLLELVLVEHAERLHVHLLELLGELS